MKSKPIKRHEKTPSTASIISLQQKITKLQIQIVCLQQKILKLETIKFDQKQKISRLQIENDKLRVEKPGIEDVLDQITSRRIEK